MEDAVRKGYGEYLIMFVVLIKDLLNQRYRTLIRIRIRQ